ncbi:hypothetical protein [Singulisphaera sp. PoT]|uniref:hypothetical protein n=1 Tax=Singulisphaera sp. PoT TaxID=3411797 RepID=UPI003BF592DD
MSRSSLFALVVVLLGSTSAHAQFGGMGGMGGGMGGGQGMGGMGMGMGMGGMMARNGRMVPQTPPEEWNIKAELDGDRVVSGSLSLYNIMVEGDIGEYEIKPEKVKAIQFEKGATIQQSPNGPQIPGTVITTSDEKVTGLISLPSWRFKIELGILKPDPKKLRVVSFLSKVKVEEPKKPKASEKKADDDDADEDEEKAKS